MPSAFRILFENLKNVYVRFVFAGFQVLLHTGKRCMIKFVTLIMNDVKSVCKLL